MISDPPEEPAAPAAGPDHAQRPQRRRRSVRSQSALAVVGRSSVGTPYSAWADSYLRKPEFLPAFESSECTPAQTGASASSGAPGSGREPLPPNPFDVARGGDDSPPSAAAWRHRATMSEVTLRHQPYGMDAAGIIEDPGDGRSSQRDSVDAQLRPSSGDIDEHAAQRPARVRRAGHTRRHSDASVLRCVMIV